MSERKKTDAGPAMQPFEPAAFLETVEFEPRRSLLTKNQRVIEAFSFDAIREEPDLDAS